MSNKIQDYISKAADGIDLGRDEAENAFQIIMNGGATPAQMAAFLVALRMKGESVAEITAGASVMRSKAKPFKAPEGAVDCCGTGGDAKGTLNVSTAAAIVIAACGVPVVKHGNRSVTSKSGSSDVLTELGVDVNAPVEVMEECLEKCNLAFLMAPNFHSAMRHVAPVRKELGLRTIFNLLGPLSNPAQPKFQIIGVYDPLWMVPMAHVLKELGVERAWVVHGSDGVDELTTTGPSEVVELKDGEVNPFTLHADQVGFPIVQPDDLKGKNPEYNAQALIGLLDGETTAYRDIVMLNAAAALVVAGKVENLPQGIKMSAEAIHYKKAKETLASLVSLTSEHKLTSAALAEKGNG